MARFRRLQYHPFATAITLASVLLIGTIAQARIETIVVHARSLEGNLLGDSADRQVNVYLPPAYGESAAARYPVLYLLHGYTGNHSLWTGQGYFSGMDIDAVADDLIGSGVMPPLLIVMPNADNAYWGSWYVNSEVTGNWEDFIVRELVDYVDGHYATLAQRESRALAGHSMGGYGAAYLGIKYAETYSVLYPMSAAAIDMETFILEVPVSGFPSGPTAFLTIANWDHFPGKSFTDWVAKANVALAAAIAPAPAEPRFLADMPMVEEAGEAHVDEAVFERWMAADPLSMIATHTEDLRRYAAVRVDCGDADDLIGQNRNFSAALTAAGIEHQFEDYPGNHTSNVAARMKSVVLPFIGTHLSSYPTVTTVESASWGRIKIRHVGGM